MLQNVDVFIVKYYIQKSLFIIFYDLFNKNVLLEKNVCFITSKTGMIKIIHFMYFVFHSNIISLNLSFSELSAKL